MVDIDSFIDGISPSDLEALNLAPPETLAKWWCALNSWSWPDGLPNKPDQYGACMGHHGRAWEIMCWIKRRVSKDAIQEEWEENFV